MKERPIIMGDESVRAILEGRKTQTRRVVMPSVKGCTVGAYIGGTVEPVNVAEDGDAWTDILCPYGKVGDRLWVRETWGVVSHSFDEDENICEWIPDRPAKKINEMKFGYGYYSGHVIYRADGDFEWNAGDDPSFETKSSWEPSIHMPRWASRISLEITDIRVERVQDISNKDAMAEGVEFGSGWEEQCGECYCTGEGWMDYKNADYGCSTPKESFCTLWDSINAKRGYPWEKNPWVWVITFKVV